MHDAHRHETAASQHRCRRLLTSPWLALPVRLGVGGLFVLAGFSKLMLPHAEVVALMQQYTVIPRALVPLIAASLPWLEVISGTALLIGFYTTPAALLIALQLLGFSLLMLVVILSGAVLEDCGCFGNLGWHETPLQVLIRDLLMLGMLWPVLRRRRDVCSFDAWMQASVP